MKSNLKFAITLAALACAVSSAQAQFYGEANLNQVNVKVSSGADHAESSPTTLELTAGYNAHQNLAIEGVGIFNLDGDSVKINGTNNGVTAKVANSYGVFAKPKYQISEDIQVFGRIGYTNMKITASNSGIANTTENESASYGLGASLKLNTKSYLTFGYTQYFHKDEIKIDGLSLGFGMKF